MEFCLFYILILSESSTIYLRPDTFYLRAASDQQPTTRFLLLSLENMLSYKFVLFVVNHYRFVMT